jgi:hypothetical protein
MGARVSGLWSRGLTWAAAVLMAAAVVAMLTTLAAPALGRL